MNHWLRATDVQYILTKQCIVIIQRILEQLVFRDQNSKRIQHFPEQQLTCSLCQRNAVISIGKQSIVM